MSLQISSYPVETSGGLILNVLPGFDSIQIEFTRFFNPSDLTSEFVTGIEVVIVDPSDDSVDLLGFSLFADFGLDVSGNPSPQVQENKAYIECSIVNGLNERAIQFSSGELTVSRTEFRIKWRGIYSDGTEDSYTFASGEYPIIAAYSTVDFELNKFLVNNSPKFYDGYPNIVGFYNSDKNNLGLDIKTKYDLFAIDGSTLASDQLVYDFGQASKGLCLSAVQPTVPSDSIVVLNGGGVGTTDWINPAASGAAEYWTPAGSANFSVTTGGGFIGNAQQCQLSSLGGDGASLIQDDVIPLLNTELTLTFKYTLSRDAASDAYIRVNNAAKDEVLTTVSTPGVAQEIEVDFDLTNPEIRLVFFILGDNRVVGDLFVIDEINLSYRNSQARPTSMNLKIISE